MAQGGGDFSGWHKCSTVRFYVKATVEDGWLIEGTLVSTRVY